MTTQLKCWTLVIGMFLGLYGGSPAQAQGFVNLDFESATVVPAGTGFAQFGPAFPGWTAYYNASALSPVTPITFNSPRAGTSGLGLQGMSSVPSISNYTALLQGGVGVNDVDVSLAQTGLIPAGTLSLRFQISRVFNNRPLNITLDGQLLVPIVLQDFGSFQEYGVNVPSFAGQNAELRFTQGHGSANFNNLTLDNISFSNVGVPEPGTWALLTLGGALLWCGVRRRRK